ncbi:hypothetical protein [Streptomyces sp. NPDC057910]|uniref:hypothetical protein n=1 Tax=Streptomyces sp. NPDC057910 TaxID=3346278 RepID=UPI0036E42E9E
MPAVSDSATDPIETKVWGRARTAPLFPATGPLLPSRLFAKEGWDTYVHKILEPPPLGEPPDPDAPVPPDDARLLYHGHLRVVNHRAFDSILAKTALALRVNTHRPEGLLDRCIDGWPGTGLSNERCNSGCEGY